MANEMVKLSTLAPDTMLINDTLNIMTATKLINEITRLGEKHHLNRKWSVAEKMMVGCNAKEMIENHVESIVCDAQIEDGEDLQMEIIEALRPCFPVIQAILDEALKDVNTTYWLATNRQVEIDFTL